MINSTYFYILTGVNLKNNLVFGVSLPLKEAIFHCRKDPPGDWPHDAYILIGTLFQKSKCSGYWHENVLLIKLVKFM